MKRKRRNELATIHGFECKTMTVREVADALGVDRFTVNKWVKKLFPEIVKNGKTSVLTENQVQSVKEHIGTGRNDLVNISKVNDGVSVVTKIDKEKTIALAWKYLQENIAELEKELSAERTRSTELQIRLDENNSYQSVKRFCREHDLEYALSDLQDIGREISSICRARGLPIKKVDDSNFTCVNSYPVEVLREYFF